MVGQEHRREIVRPVLLPVGMPEARNRVLLYRAPSEIPQLSARSRLDLDLVERIDLVLLRYGLQRLGQPDVLYVQEDVDPYVAEQEARQVLVRFLAVHDPEVAGMRAIGEGLRARRAELSVVVQSHAG